MNRDEILNMQPGRELDALVAEKVMGLNGLYLMSEFLKPYSSDISAAREVVEQVQQKLSAKFVLNRDPEGPFPMKWIAYFGAYEWETPRIVRDNPAEAICKAALLSLIQENTP